MVLGDLFSETDYPGDVMDRFSFKWRFLVLDVPRKSGILPPEVYKREKEKFVALMEETRQMASGALAKELGDIVSQLVEKMNCNGKTLKASFMNSLHNWLDGFETRNIFNDDKLVQMANQAKAILGGVTPYNLRYNEEMKKKITADMGKLKTRIDEAIEDLPKRKIRMAA
jgi:hypothetical protein